MKTIIKRIFIYALGIPLIALGLTLLLRSELGLSSWSTLNYSISQTFHISQGTANFLVATSTTILVTIVDKKLRYLLIIIPIFLVASTLDLMNDHILLDPSFHNIYFRTAFYISGVVIMAAGSAMLIASTFPAGIYEEFMLMIMRIFKTDKMGFTRLCIEFSVVVIAVIMGFMNGFGFGGVNIGTLIISLVFGYILSFFLKLYKKIGF